MDPSNPKPLITPGTHADWFPLGSEDPMRVKILRDHGDGWVTVTAGWEMFTGFAKRSQLTNISEP